MSWRDQLREASFRGARFYVEGGGGNFGRRIQVHEFPQRDKPYTEDLGRKARTLTLTAWVVADCDNGLMHWPERDALIAACEAYGAGTLVHPYLGEMEGFCEVTYEESAQKQGGLARFSLSFTEGGDYEFQSDIDTYARSDFAVAAVYAAAAQEFEKAFSVAGFQGFVVEDSLSMVAQFVNQATAGGTASAQNPEVWRRNVFNLQNAGAGLVYNAAELASNITSFVSLSDDVTALHNFSRNKPPSFNTTSRTAQRNNQDAFVHLVRTAAATRRAEQSITLANFSQRQGVDSVSTRGVPRWVTHEDLNGERSLVANLINAELNVLSSLALYPVSQQKLVKLRTEVVQHITKLGETLARTTTFSYATSMPAVRVAHQHYGELRDDEIVVRNRIKNPLFIPAHSMIELLTA